MNKELRFKPTIDGCAEAIKWLRYTGNYTRRFENMDGYNLVVEANKLYEKPIKNDTKPIKSR